MKIESTDLVNYKRSQRIIASKKRKAYTEKRFKQRKESGRTSIFFFKIFRAICVLCYACIMISLVYSGHWIGSLVLIPFGFLTWMAFDFYTSEKSIHYYQNWRGKLRRKW